MELFPPKQNPATKVICIWKTDSESMHPEKKKETHNFVKPPVKRQTDKERFKK